MDAKTIIAIVLKLHDEHGTFHEHGTFPFH